MNLIIPSLNRSKDRPAHETTLQKFMRDLSEPDNQVSYGIGNGSNHDGASWDREDYLDCARNLGLMPI